jgi:hypothetical protein
VTDDTQTTFGKQEVEDGIEGEWELVRSWQSFLDFFEDAVHIDAVTYCESPGLIRDLFRESSEIPTVVESIDILIGNRSEYRTALNDVDTAHRLSELYREGKLTIRLKNRRVVHSKLYRIVKPDEIVLLHGSANFSYNAWKNQSNSFTVWRTHEGSKKDEGFLDLIEEHREAYGHKVFLEEFTAEQLEPAEDEEEERRRMELWLDDRMDELSDRARIHTETEDELEQLGEAIDETVAVTDDSDQADETADFEDVPPAISDATLSVQSPTNSSESESAESSGSEISETDNPDEEGEDAAVGDGKPLVPEAASPTVLTEGYQLTLPTEAVSDSSYANALATDFENRGGTRTQTGVTTPIAAYSEFYQTEYDEELMYLRPEDTALHVQCGDKHKQVIAQEPAAPATLNACLDHLERYITTVDRWGYNTTTQTAVKAHMYEALLFGMWSPFVNLYAEALDGPATRLDNDLPYLYISGPSDAGKDITTEVIARLITDGLVTDAGADADQIGTKDIRRLREINTPFPFIINDIEKDKIRQISAFRNFWKDWQPSQDISYPTIILTSNDTRPKDWFRNRARMLHFDVVFPSNSEEENYYDAKEDLERILTQHNPIFRFVARRLLTAERYADGDGTVKHVREIMLEIYNDANRPVPEYFPRKPASREYNVGKRKWNNAIERGDVQFEEQNDQLIAEFDAESSEVYSFRKTLDPKCKPEKVGRRIIIKNPEHFRNWVETDLESSSWLPGWFR